MIEVQRIAKRFGEVEALKDVSFTARDGRIMGLLGPNGAGKSTCLRVICSILKPDTGAVTVDSIDVQTDPLEIKRRLGVLPHSAGLYPQLTARENIRYFGELHGRKSDALEPRIDSLLQRLELTEIADRKANGFSQGERTKVALARALIHEPSHLLLDEPTNGLDVMATRSLRRWLNEIRQEGRCIVLSSHIMQEVTALCDDIVILAHGSVVAEGTAEELKDRFDQASLEDIFVEMVGHHE